MSLQTIHDRVKESADMTELSPSLVMRIAQRLESAIARAKQSEARDLAADLRAVVSLLLARSEPDVRTAVRGGSAANLSLRQAYSLGKASFAQGLAEQMAERREADNFLEYLNSQSTRPYVQALLRQSLSGQELAAATGREEESVSRKLKILRELRITDFRKEGRNIINFLTPVARAALTANEESNQRPPAITLAVGSKAGVSSGRGRYAQLFNALPDVAPVHVTFQWSTSALMRSKLTTNGSEN